MLPLNNSSTICIKEAKEEFILVSPYFVPGKVGVDALCELSKQGVKVHVLTNSLASNDVAAVHTGYTRHRKELLRCGVQLSVRVSSTIKNRVKTSFWHGLGANTRYTSTRNSASYCYRVVLSILWAAKQSYRSCLHWAICINLSQPVSVPADASSMMFDSDDPLFLRKLACFVLVKCFYDFKIFLDITTRVGRLARILCMILFL